MVLDQFRNGFREYGVLRVLLEFDFLLSISIAVSLTIWRYWGCSWIIGSCRSLYNEQFLSLGTEFSIALTAFILAGLAVLISFTDRDFLLQLSELGIYTNIMFVFQYNLYLAGFTAVTGILTISLSDSDTFFIIFVFFFTYMILSLTAMVDLVVRYGVQRANYENSK